MEQFIRNNKICAILRHIPLNLTPDYAQAVFDGGVRMFEVALNSPDAYEQIAVLRKRFGDTAAVGAGTAVTGEKIKRALEAGAQFMLTPSATVEALIYCREHNVPLLPGVMTPSDVDVCIAHGYTTLKLFPAGDLPPGYIKSLQGPFDMTRYVAVGGVSPDNIQDFFKRGFVGVGIGSNLIPKEYISAGDWEKARDYVAGMLDRVRGFM